MNQDGVCDLVWTVFQVHRFAEGLDLRAQQKMLRTLPGWFTSDPFSDGLRPTQPSQCREGAWWRALGLDFREGGCCKQ